MEASSTTGSAPQTGKHGLRSNAISAVMTTICVLGTELLFAWRRYKREPFFIRRREVADPALLHQPAVEPAPTVAGGSE